MIQELKEFGIEVSCFDPQADANEVLHEYNFKIESSISSTPYDAIILAVSHTQFLSLNYQSLLKSNGVLFDVKSILPKEQVDGRL